MCHYQLLALPSQADYTCLKSSTQTEDCRPCRLVDLVGRTHTNQRNDLTVEAQSLDINMEWNCQNFLIIKISKIYIYIYMGNSRYSMRCHQAHQVDAERVLYSVSQRQSSEPIVECIRLTLLIQFLEQNSYTCPCLAMIGKLLKTNSVIQDQACSGNCAS